ncbi:MAG: hypothetical protein C5B52_08710 [Bacteroidetes bacterium]|nr:MAG: hypothetical protein C5B52_08710 [Bacteroidota bacterium]
MKKLIILTCSTLLLMASTYARTPEVNEKVLKAFNETFTNAQQVNWEEKDGSYTVHFTQTTVRYRVNYDLQGNIVSSIRYYDPSMLPTNILSLLKKKHSQKTLYGVTEVTVGSDVAYFIKMFDDKNWYTVKADGSGSNDIVEKYRKN